MSWKIYNAYRTAAHPSIVMQGAMRHREAAYAEWNTTCKSCLEAAATPAEGIAAFDYPTREFNRRLTATVLSYNIMCGYNGLNPECSLVIFPREDREGNLVQFFGIRDTTDALAKHYTEVKFYDYHWQDQCDKPKEVSQTAWNRRRKVWTKEIYGGNEKRPAQLGLSFDIVSKEDALVALWQQWCVVGKADPDTPPEKQYDPDWAGYFLGHSAAQQIPETKLEWLTDKFPPADKERVYRTLTGHGRKYHWPADFQHGEGEGI